MLDDANHRYAVRLIERGGDAYTAMGWLNYDDEGRFVGALSAPLRLALDGDTVRALP